MDPLTEAYVRLLIGGGNPTSNLGMQNQGFNMGGMPDFVGGGFPFQQQFSMPQMDQMGGFGGMMPQPQMIETQPPEQREPQYSQNRSQPNFYSQGGEVPQPPMAPQGPPPGPPPNMPSPQPNAMSQQSQQQKMPGAQGQYEQLLGGQNMDMMGDALSQNFNMQNERKAQMMDTISNYQQMI